MKRLLFILLLLCALSVGAQDTVRHHLEAVGVEAERVPVPTLTQVPTQVLPAERIEQQGMATLGEVSRMLSGVTLKDYGGVGGMKTISARGLGSQFSSLTLDGVAVSDCQNGQVDLGRYSLGDAEYVCFVMGQEGSTLQSARALAAGNVMNMESRRPDSTGGRVHLEAGSFGLLSPAFTWRHKVNQHWSYSLWANYMRSKGDYPFTLYYTLSGQDSTSRERRAHSAVQSATLEGNLFYCDGQHDLVLKVRHYQSDMQLPGAVIFYTQNGSEQTTSRVSFAQGRYRYRISDYWRLQLIGKYSNVQDTYSDTLRQNPFQNRYLQQEGYLSAALSYEPIDRLTFSLTSDEAISSLHSNLAHHNRVQRLSLQSVVMANWRREWIDLTANALLTLSGEESCEGLQRRYQRLSPYAGVNLRLWRSSDYRNQLRIRYFFKENYRLPNFNEVYFFSMTRVNLRPEKALQHNLGLTYSSQCPMFNAQVTLDAYRNRVTDKIVAFPAQSLFLWSMQNLGRVEIMGVDMACELSYKQLSLRLTYTFQQAEDVTDPASKTYRQQIPYTPRHSGGALLTCDTRWFTASYNAILVGERYSLGQNAPNYRLRPYVDQGLALSRTWGPYDVRLQCLNLFDVQYEVVQCYPMMGRNYRVIINYKF